MSGAIPAEPAHRLPASAKGYWRWSTALGVVPPLVGAMALGRALPDPLGVVLPVVVVVAGLIAVAVVPGLRWRRWRYEIRDEEIDLQHGTFIVRRTLVPIRRVQHVDSETGPLQGNFGLSSVSFHTAAGATTIPALGSDEAARVRTRVAELARTRDDV